MKKEGMTVKGKEESVEGRMESVEGRMVRLQKEGKIGEGRMVKMKIEEGRIWKDCRMKGVLEKEGWYRYEEGRRVGMEDGRIST